MTGPRFQPQIITFYSYKGGTGRTMALANVAWILASNGLRVLAVDWDLESPGLHRYFHPFLRDKQLHSTTGVIDLVRDYAAAATGPELYQDDAWVAEYAKVLHHAVSLDWLFPDQGTVDFLAAGKQDRSYSQTVSTFDWGAFFERLGGAAFLRLLREDMLQHYDYVLIDSRTGLSDAAGICTVELPDAVVDCFTLSTQSIEGAAAVAWSIKQQRPEPVRLLPVPMRVENAQMNKLEAGREYARRLFEPFLAHLSTRQLSEYWGEVEIPYNTFYAYEEILTPFGEEPYQYSSLLAAFERLTAVVSGGRVTKAGIIAEPERRRFLSQFERTRSPVAADVLISHASVDRMWAEWIAGELEDGGLTVHLQAVDSTNTRSAGWAELEKELGRAIQVVILLSGEYAKAPNAAAVWKLASQPESGMPPRLITPVRLDAVRLGAPFNDRPGIELAVLSEDRARAALRELFEFRAPAPGGPASHGDQARRPRFPSSPVPVWRVPPRNATFTGRGSTLDTIRDRLSATPTVVVPQALFGLGGVGKTQVALEYAHRFAANYDVVWWISAEQPSTARKDLFELAEALGLARESTVDTIPDLLEALRKGVPSQRWLLIYDNADNPDDLRDLIPQGTGHMLFTSRNMSWASQATEAVELGVFDRTESVTFLRRQVPSLTAEDADLLAENLGDLPLAVEQAAAWLLATGMDVQQYVDLLETEPTELLNQYQAAGYPRTATATWQVSLRRLREQMPAAAKALEVCAFFAPEPIPLSLLSHERFLGILRPYDESLKLPIMAGRLTREIFRFALARVDRSRNSIVIHRLVQAIIRAQLTPEQADTARTQAYEVLAAANPSTTDDPNKWAAFDELWPHLRIPGLLESPADDVRQLIVDMVRYRYRKYDFTGSAELAEAALAKWRALYGDDDPLTLHLRFHLANAFRSQARYKDSLALNEDILHRLRQAVGPDHPYTLMAAGGLAADRRALGDFTIARDLDVDTAARFREAFGDDDYRALMATNNLAVSLRMVGDYRAAAELDLDVYTRRRSVLGDLHPYTLFSASNYGSDLREIGDFASSRSLLEATLRSYRAVIGEDQTDTLRTARNLAVTLRRLGEFIPAHELSVDTLDRYVRALGTEHPDTLLCEITVASTYAGIGDNEHAKSIAESTLDKMQRILNEEHVQTKVCRHNLSIYQLKTDGAAEALPLAEGVHQRFLETLGPDHPYSLNSALNVANIRWALGDHAGARDLDERTYLRLRDTLGDDHPDTLTAAINLLVSSAGVDATFDALVAERLLAFADRHPRALSVQPGERINTYIEPPSP